jgi:hypothetical protein
VFFIHVVFKMCLFCYVVYFVFGVKHSLSQLLRFALASFTEALIIGSASFPECAAKPCVSLFVPSLDQASVSFAPVDDVELVLVHFLMISRSPVHQAPSC